MNTQRTLYKLYLWRCQQLIKLKILPALVISLALGLPIICFALDSDGDGLDDILDNCSLVANPDQRDSNNDGFGNLCDADLDNSGLVGFADLNLFKIAFGTNDADADLDGNGRVSFADLNIFRSLFNKPPGPGTGNRMAASRFLTQATFGPTTGAIDHLISLGSFEAWIDDQINNTSPSLLLPGTYAMYQARHAYCLANPPESGCPVSLTEVTTAGVDGLFDVESIQYRFVWWNNAVDGADQLRQRVAFALSEILVVADRPIELQRSQFAMASYYDMLSQHAFGNYRDLLGDVSLHPVMGIYLGHVKNEKADLTRNIRPDENYAREVMQLFSIGLHELNLDGTLQRDAEGKPIPAYGQFEVQEFARVFTGWNFNNTNWAQGGSDHAHADNTLPMEAHEEFHDTEEKQLLNGAPPLPAGQNARQDLDDALDNIFNHPNVGPFIGKLLIQRLVSSNPSPAYVSRVASKFNDNGLGIRGDMAAVVKAILLDDEARKDYKNITGFGKLREPLLRITHLLRTFNAVKVENNPWPWIIPAGVPLYTVDYQTDFNLSIAQRILDAPSVFNFFLPDYSPPGVIRDLELVAPEFQIVTENTSMALTNILNTLIYRPPHTFWSSLRLDNEVAIAVNLDALLEHLNIVLMSGGMSDELRAIIRPHLDDPSFDNVNLSQQEKVLAKVRDAISLIVNSPEYMIQK